MASEPNRIREIVERKYSSALGADVWRIDCDFAERAARAVLEEAIIVVRDYQPRSNADGTDWTHADELRRHFGLK